MTLQRKTPLRSTSTLKRSNPMARRAKKKRAAVPVVGLMFGKRVPLELPALRRAALGNDCIRCGNPGVSVGAHYTGWRQHDFGKGRGQKCDDHCLADLCDDCHTYFDQPDEHKSVERSEEFMFYVLLTLRRRFDEGVLTVGRGEA